MSRRPGSVASWLRALALLSGIAILSVAVSPPLPTAHAALSGDLDCDGSVNLGDVSVELRVVAGLPPGTDCAPPVDVDCDGNATVLDALALLRQGAGISPRLPVGCVAIGLPLADTAPGEAATLLAARINNPPDLAGAVEGVQAALAWAGVGTGDGETTFVQPLDPATESVAVPLESLKLALETQSKGTIQRLSLDELGQTFRDFGWPFDANPTPGRQMANFLAAWIGHAQSEPNDPESFVPLFLQQMALSRDTDLVAKDSETADVHFTLLELELLAAAFDRITVHPLQLAEAPSAPATPCSDARKFISEKKSPFAGQVMGIVENESEGFFTREFLQMAGVSEGSTEDFSNAMAATGIAARLWRLAALYSNAEVSVVVHGDNPVHELNETEPGPLLKQFEATAGVSEEDWRAYQDRLGDIGMDVNSAVRDCLNEYGIPTIADLGEIVKDSQNWAVEWTVSQPSPEHATWSPDQQISPGFVHLGKWRAGLDRTTPHSAQTSFVMQIAEEKTTDHPGLLKTAPVRVCADVDTSQPPSLQTFVNAAKGLLGLADAIAELAGGWFQKMVRPTSCETLKVTYHVPCPATSTSASMTTESVPVLPCAWEGTTNTSDSRDYSSSSSSYHRALTTSGQLVWERKPENFIDFDCEVLSPPCVVYFASGTVRWHYEYSVTSGDYHCDDERSGSFEVNPPSDPGDWWIQNLVVQPGDGGSTYTAAGNYYVEGLPGMFQTSCEGTQSCCPWLNVDDPREVSPDGQTITGNYAIPSADPPGLHEYTWEFHAAECGTAPVPACQ